MFPFDYWFLPWSGQKCVEPEGLTAPWLDLQATHTHEECMVNESSHPHFLVWGRDGVQPIW